MSTWDGFLKWAESHGRKPNRDERCKDDIEVIDILVDAIRKQAELEENGIDDLPEIKKAIDSLGDYIQL